jgi:YHS domain-containing protein
MGNLLVLMMKKSSYIYPRTGLITFKMHEVCDKKNHLAIRRVFYCLWSLWVILSLAGCNRNTKNIYPASYLASGEVTLLWNDIPNVNSYNVYVSNSRGVTKLNGIKIRNVKNPVKITQLEPGKTYYFIVTVVNEQGESEESKELSYTAVAYKIGLVYFKDLFYQSILDHKSISAEKGAVIITWDKVPNATSFNIYWNDSPGVTKHNGKKIANVKSPHKIEGLKRGITYYFVITAVNVFKESEDSEEFSLTAD